MKTRLNLVTWQFLPPPFKYELRNPWSRRVRTESFFPLRGACQRFGVEFLDEFPFIVLLKNTHIDFYPFPSTEKGDCVSPRFSVGGDFQKWGANLSPLSDFTRYVGVFYWWIGRSVLVCWLRKPLFNARIIVDGSCLRFLYWALEMGLH